MNKLKKCPFCDGEAEILKDNECWGHGEFAKRVTIRCKKCSVRLSVSNLNSEIAIKHKAIEAWNTRKPMQNIVERLEEELRFAKEEKDRCVIKALPYYDNVKGYATGMHNAIEIAKEEGEI